MWRAADLRAGSTTLLCVAGLLAACAGESPGSEHTGELQQTAIVGNDDRIDYGALNLSDPAHLRFKRAADATAAIVDGRYVMSLPALSLVTNCTYWETENGYDLCSWERFRGELQLPSPVGTGFLVAPDIVATAKHVLDVASCAAMRIVFGFVNGEEQVSAPLGIPVVNIYRCVGQIPSPVRAEDWALIKLDRVVTGRTPLVMRYSGELAVQSELFATGHPKRLPMKIAAWGTKWADYDAAWSSTLDVLGGNSGSPILNLATGVVEGIHSNSTSGFVITDLGGGEVCTELEPSSTNGLHAYAASAAAHLPLHTALVAASAF
jgi:hypothetical protein